MLFNLEELEAWLLQSSKEHNQAMSLMKMKDW